jgi:hypothetical protein
MNERSSVKRSAEPNADNQLTLDLPAGLPEPQPEEGRLIGVYLCFPLNTDFEIARKRFIEAIERFRSIARFRLRAGGAFCVDEYAVVRAG